MKRKRKTFALVCLSVTLYHTFSPLAALALTSGPVSPDASSFEPVDTSTMVNPLTGDFIYNVPLMEVPGPEGSYPLSLSYHAGINPDQESSWVGLGWTLNPGSIARSISGFPDDWANTQASRRDYWEGGVTNTTSVGVNIPYFNISANVAVVKDTYRGVGVGWNVGYGFGVGGGASAFVGIGSNPYSNGFSIMGGVGVGGVSLTGSLGETNSIGVSASLLSVGPYNVLGASLSTGGSGFSFSSPIESKLSNTREGIVQTETKSKSLNLIFFNYSNTRTRYWTDETESSNIYGALNAKSFTGLLTDNQLVNDSYQLPSMMAFSIYSPEKYEGGSFPAFDGYTVTGQGIGGLLRPYLYQGSVSKQNVVERTTSSSSQRTVQYANNSKVSNNLGFRFVGDFSNTLLQENNSVSGDANTILNGSLPFSSPYGNGPDWSNGYNASNQVLAGSKSIQFFKVDANGNVIAPNSNIKFVKPVALGLDRKKHLGALAPGTTSSNITGFVITNESGVTYHYNLPAYNYDEEIYQENLNKKNGLRFNRQTKSAGYAYIWHLTAITGPDYVDRGRIGELDEADYGYWVSFEYGKWTDEFVWRTPVQGQSINFDQNFRMVSMGKKEIYYLNSIKTRTHTALFEKDVRLDGKSASKESFNKNWSSQNNVSTDYNNRGVFNINSNQSLRLDRIYIMKNGDSNIVPNFGGNAGLLPQGRTVECSACELVNNVLDKNDVNAYGRSRLISESARVIDLNYDYSLAKGTTTSFNFSNPDSKMGKLTLKSFQVKGKNGVSILPQTEFDYNLSLINQKKGKGTVANGTITNATVDYEVGDLIETDEVNPVYCGYIYQVTKIGANLYNYVIKGNASLGNLGTINIRRTKNPPFLQNNFDFWGMFKSDVNFDTETYVDQNLARKPTEISNKSTDVWSLRRIKTTNGSIISIDYEGHDFDRSIYGKNRSIWSTSLTRISPGVYSMSGETYGQSYNNFFEVGEQVDPTFYRKGYYEFDEEVNGIPIEFQAEERLHALGIIKSVSPNNLIIDITESAEKSMLHSNIYNVKYQFIEANIPATETRKINRGGMGVRVKSMTITGLDGVMTQTNYSYRDENNRSSGTTISEPLNFEEIPKTYYRSRENRNLHEMHLNDDFIEMARFGPELPSSGVMYSTIIVTNSIRYPDGANQVVPNKVVYNYFTYPDLKIEKKYIDGTEINSSRVLTDNIVLRKFVGLLGLPKSISYYDGNGKLTKRIVKQYLHDGIATGLFSDFFAEYKDRMQKYRYQGLITERFSESKKVLIDTDSWTKGVLIAREDYPAINTGTVEYDYIHNTKTSTEVNAFDFYSGAVTESIGRDSYGNSFLSQSIPAYKDFPAMGPNQLDGTKKNMLTQVSANNVYRLNASGAKEYLVSANYNVWRNGAQILNENGDRMVQNNAATNGNVWRQTASYIWMPSSVAVNGMTVVGNFVAFPGSSPTSANAAWKKSSETVLMDPYSHVLSTMDFKGNHVSTRYGYNNAKPVLSGTFAKYGEIAFSGAEDENISNSKKLEVKKGEGEFSTIPINVHTGKMGLGVLPGKTGFEYSVPVSELTLGRTYTASVWVKVGATNDVKLYYQLDGVQKIVSTASNVSTKISGSWALINFDIAISGGTAVKIFAKNDGTAVAFMDDFRFQPKNATTSASVYDPATGELTYTLDQNNLFTRYEYNAMGQVIAIYREQFGRAPYKVSETQLNQSTRSFNGLPN